MIAELSLKNVFNTHTRTSVKKVLEHTSDFHTKKLRKKKQKLVFDTKKGRKKFPFRPRSVVTEFQLVTKHKTELYSTKRVYVQKREKRAAVHVPSLVLMAAAGASTSPRLLLCPLWEAKDLTRAWTAWRLP
jgi:hypothetical protein